MYVVFENIRSVYNVGSVFRTMEGFGFKHAVLIGITPTPIDKNGIKRKDFIKTALGAEDRIDWEYFETVQDFVNKNKNINLIALESTTDSKDIGNIKTHNGNTKKLALILGSEVYGVEYSTLSICKEVYHIPMLGEKESFNVSVAAGIALYLISN